MGFKAWTGVDGRLVAIPILISLAFLPVERAKDYLDDTVVFYVLGLLFVVVSIIGTKVVLSCGDLPANDELFNLSERQLTPAQQAALRGDHARGSGAAADG